MLVAADASAASLCESGLEYNGVEKDFQNGEYGPKLVNDFALSFLERHRNEPFFLYYPMILTHNPFQPTLIVLIGIPGCW